MKVSPDLLNQFCDVLAATGGNRRKSAKGAGISYSHVFRLMKESRENPTRYIHSWDDSPPQAFHLNVKLAQTVASAKLREKIVDMSLHGETTDTVYFSGR